MNQNYAYLLVPVFLALLVSCNVYRPFDSKSSPEDYIEAAQKCLHEGNYACAIENYSQLPDPLMRTEKLCVVNIARAGFTLSALIGAFEKKNAKVIGDIANIFIPWNAERHAAADDAKSYCGQYSDDAKNDLGILLQAISAIVHCAMRMAKADVCNCTSDSQTTCTPVAGDGKVTAADIGPVTGILSETTPGMCAADANACADDFVSIDTTKLNNARLEELKAVYESVPAGTKTVGQPIPVRAGLVQTL